MNTSLSYGGIHRLQHALLLNELFIIWNYGYAFWTSSILNFQSNDVEITIIQVVKIS